MCQPPLPQPLLPLESGLVPPCPPARWPTSGSRAAARSSPAWTRCPGSSICNNRQSLSSFFQRRFLSTTLWMHEDTLSINFDKQDGKWWPRLKSSLVKTSKKRKRPTAGRRSDRAHLPLVLLRSCWCKYKTAQMEIWLQRYLTFSSYKLV